MFNFCAKIALLQFVPGLVLAGSVSDIFDHGFESPADCVDNVCPANYVTGSTRSVLNWSAYFLGAEFINAPSEASGGSLLSITAFVNIPGGVDCNVDFYVWQTTGVPALEWSASTPVSGPASEVVSDPLEQFLSDGFEYTVGYGVVCSGVVGLYYGDVTLDPVDVPYDSGDGLFYQTAYIDSSYAGFSPTYDPTLATSNTSFTPHMLYRVRPE